MLVLTRRNGESIRIGDDVVVTIAHVGNGKVRVGIEAPADKTVLRAELVAGAARPPRTPLVPVEIAMDARNDKCVG